MGGYLEKSRNKTRGDGCGEAGEEVPPIKSRKGGGGLVGGRRGEDEACLRARGGPMLRVFLSMR